MYGLLSSGLSFSHFFVDQGELTNEKASFDFCDAGAYSGERSG